MSVSLRRKVFVSPTVSAAITLWKKVLHPPTPQGQNLRLTLWKVTRRVVTVKYAVLVVAWSVTSAYISTIL
jgi:hypothetical protein